MSSAWNNATAIGVEPIVQPGIGLPVLARAARSYVTDDFAWPGPPSRSVIAPKGNPIVQNQRVTLGEISEAGISPSGMAASSKVAKVSNQNVGNVGDVGPFRHERPGRWVTTGVLIPNAWLWDRAPHGKAGIGSMASTIWLSQLSPFGVSPEAQAEAPLARGGRNLLKLPWGKLLEAQFRRGQFGQALTFLVSEGLQRGVVEPDHEVASRKRLKYPHNSDFHDYFLQTRFTSPGSPAVMPASDMVLAQIRIQPYGRISRRARDLFHGVKQRKIERAMLQGLGDSPLAGFGSRRQSIAIICDTLHPLVEWRTIGYSIFFFFFRVPVVIWETISGKSAICSEMKRRRTSGRLTEWCKLNSMTVVLPGHRPTIEGRIGAGGKS